jgi:acyl carrier protein
MINNFQKQVLMKNFKFNIFSNKTSVFKIFTFQKFSFTAGAAAEKLPTLEGRPTDKAGPETTQTRSIQPWVEVENRLAKLRGELVLSDQGKIESYVLGVIRGYFRTTYKEGLNLESKLVDHGLDSLDSIEIGMILEDELGYIIEAETLPQFTKVKHFVNYIKQIEAYKKEHILLPQVRAQEPEENWNDWIPYGEKLKSKLFKMTTSAPGDKNAKKGKEHQEKKH